MGALYQTEKELMQSENTKETQFKKKRNKYHVQIRKIKEHPEKKETQFKKKRNKYHVQTRKIKEHPEKEIQRKEKVKQTRKPEKESKALIHRKHINQHGKDGMAIK